MFPFTVTTIQPAHFAPLERLQQICYPTLGQQELMVAEHFASQHRIFAEGQIVVLDGEQVIGQGSGFFTDFDFDHPDHTFSEICAGFYFTNHDP
ncbi:MAG: GNAT family N-acetyltransferase, partial [Caldilineaceae bacterium]|nr:GNAT family N-acetyltransferase [Caldilineaceae bacterium]